MFRFKMIKIVDRLGGFIRYITDRHEVTFVRRFHPKICVCVIV